MKTHPDQHGGSAEQFLHIRHAFESIQQQLQGKGPPGWSAEELKEWWEDETGDFLSFSMSDDTRQEVIDAFHAMGPTEGRDKGGYWEMARQLAERDALMKKQGKSPAEEDRPVPQLETSSVVNRRRRRR
eukprot:scaffold18607_cov98-Amphora_coffeaeformis.AAC.1